MPNKKIYRFIFQSTIASIFILGGSSLLRSGSAQNNQQHTYAGAALLALGTLGTVDSMRKAQAYNRGE